MSIAFASPWLLWFLAGLPALWWILRLTPPAPRRISLPTFSLLKDLAHSEETPQNTPWWILLLRLMIAGFLITGFAKPVLNAETYAIGHGSIFIAMDNDWASARDWSDRQRKALHLVQEAEKQGKKVIILPTAFQQDGLPVQVTGSLDPSAAEVEIRHLKPQPWPADWKAARQALASLVRTDIGDPFWIASGLGGVEAHQFHDALAGEGKVHTLLTPSPIYVLTYPQNNTNSDTLSVRRLQTDTNATIAVQAIARDGNVVARLPASFKPGDSWVLVKTDLPLDVRNEIVRFEIEGQHHAGAILLMDSDWQHKMVGIVGEQTEVDRHSLLSSLYYLDRALEPYATVRVDHLDNLLTLNSPIIVLPDTVTLNDDDTSHLLEWIRKGGVLVRFAGENIATTLTPQEMAIIPVTLRASDRALGGALSWATPQKLHSFPSTSPFYGLSIPDDVVINRQILAEPEADLLSKTWASLEDGTPLVTAKKIGQGLSVLFHIPASTTWSNLPLSGLFVDMLKRLTNLAHGNKSIAGTSFSNLPPYQILDAFGDLQSPPSSVEMLTSASLSQTTPNFHTPPGLYGTATYNHALNLGPSLQPLPFLADVPADKTEENSNERDLGPALLAVALALLLVDTLISLHLRGYLPFKRLVAAYILIGLCLLPTSGHAREAKNDAVEFTSKTYLAYVITGDNATDHAVEMGLTSLAKALQLRTSIDHVGVVGLDLNADDLSFFPLIYWPLLANESPLSARGVTHVNDYLHHGGMILFDTMNGEEMPPALLKHILNGIDLPPMVPLPEDHVLKRSFYLLNDFSGRYNSTGLWIEPDTLSSYDGVSTVVYGINGWADAWATDNNGTYLFPCIPDGELQREHAFRFGINLVMVALTGSYKSDQIHMQALLEKFGK